jgi:hypothetical protein
MVRCGEVGWQAGGRTTADLHGGHGFRDRQLRVREEGGPLRGG